MSKVVFVCDIDGTLADFKHREALLRQFCMGCAAEKRVDSKECPYCQADGLYHTPLSSWKAFTAPQHLSGDLPFPSAQKVLQQARTLNADIHFVTGRRGESRQATQEWLTKHYGFDNTKNRLIMREAHNYEDTTAVDANVPATVYKERAFAKLKEMCGYSGAETFVFFEDDLHVLPLYSKYGFAMKAPECWGLMAHAAPSLPEQILNK